jgi:hypothetical protein
MSVSGHYIANRVHSGATAYVRSYVKIVQNDLLAAFTDLNDRATKIQDEEYRRLCELPAANDFDSDLSGLADQSHEAGMVFYTTMTDLRQAMLALFSVGLFHSIEQHLKNVCDDASFGEPPPGDTKLSLLVDWYQRHFRLNLKSLTNWNQIETLQQIANTVKHGAGASEKQLRQRCPELFEDQALRELLPDFSDIYTSPRTRLPLAGQDLFISEEKFAELGMSAIAFTVEIAEHFQNQSEHFFVNT